MSDLIPLACDLVADPWWRWLPGMLSTSRGRWQDLGGGLVGPRWPGGLVPPGRGYTPIPDLSDPCTLGGVLALVREAYSGPRIFVRWVDVYGDSDTPTGGYWHCNAGTTGASEAEALVRALQAAPPRGAR